MIYRYPSTAYVRTRLTVVLTFMLALVLALSGCGGGSSNSSNTGGTTPTTSGPSTGITNPGNNGGTGSGPAALFPPKFVYALNGATVSNVAVTSFRIDPSTGVLSSMNTISLGSNHLTGMAATPVTGYVFVADCIAKTIMTLRTDPNTGALTQSSSISVPDVQG